MKPLKSLCFIPWATCQSQNQSIHFFEEAFFYDNGGTPTDASDDVLGILVWKVVYNGFNVPATDIWQLVDITTDIFWIFVSQSAQGSGVIHNFNATLDDWINNSPQGQPADPSISLSADTYIFGAIIGIGSDWGSSFNGYVDAIRVAFGSADDTLFNFEASSTFIPNNNPDVIFDDSFSVLNVCHDISCFFNSWLLTFLYSNFIDGFKHRFQNPFKQWL